MRRWTIYFWEPCLSPHKLALFRALMAHPLVDGCVYVTQQEQLAERVSQGWELDATDDLDIRVGPDGAQVRRIVADAPANTLHLFSTVHGVPCVAHGIRAAASAGIPFAIMAEPRVREGMRGLLRFAHSWMTEHVVRRHAAAILAIGRNGPAWFRRTGYRQALIFPFAYFLPIQPPRPRIEAPGLPVIGYLGRINRSKGIHLFLAALSRLQTELRVEIAGTGPDVAAVEDFCAKQPGRRRFHGPIPMSTTPAFLSALDILVVPSTTTDDGWGAVVSEALMAGARVVATAKVGASICLGAPWRGAVVASTDPADVAGAVSRLLADHQDNDDARARRSGWGNRHLSGEAGAIYLMDILAHRFDGAPRPLAFYDDHSDAETM